jgi:hypothetical protein
LDQTDEEKSLQLAHCQAIQTCGEIYYLFASPQEVASRVRELRFPARDAKAPRRAVNLPYNSLGPLFKGRDVELAELRQRLMAGGGTAVGLTARRAIHGLGGVGKTCLAVEYAWRQAIDYETAILFVSVRSPADFRINLAALCNADILNLPEQNQPEEAARLPAVFRWLNEHSGWLLILDNADTPDAAVEVEKILPKLQGGGVIITSRIADWSAAVQTTELDVLGEQDAVAFLLERTEPRRKKWLPMPKRLLFSRTNWEASPWLWNKRALTSPRTAAPSPNTANDGGTSSCRQIGDAQAERPRRRVLRSE